MLNKNENIEVVLNPGGNSAILIVGDSSPVRMARIIIYDTEGNIAMNFTSDKNPVDIDLTGRPVGQYYLHYYSGLGVQQTGFFVSRNN